jgi:hypothetical protein
MPEKVGLTFDASVIKWYVLEIHYDNPSGAADIVDGSGVTVQVRHGNVHAVEHAAAGYLWAGLNMPAISVPPGIPRYEISSQCTFPDIPEDGITMFAAGLHAHKLGTVIVSDQIGVARRMRLNPTPVARQMA